jgi:hypothetical protein
VQCGPGNEATLDKLSARQDWGRIGGYAAVSIDSQRLIFYELSKSRKNFMRDHGMHPPYEHRFPRGPALTNKELL